MRTPVVHAEHPVREGYVFPFIACRRDPPRTRVEVRHYSQSNEVTCKRCRAILERPKPEAGQ